MELEASDSSPVHLRFRIMPFGLMDISGTLLALYAQKKRLENAIAELERLSGKCPTRRGRRFMGPVERQDVSERMKRYWAGRRAAKKHSEDRNP